jgi:uroporphyrinogen-III synthase
MSNKPQIVSALKNKVIAVPESRQLDILASLFERRQAEVIRVPLVSIKDSLNQDKVLAWIKCFISNPPDLLVILTGEGLRRLLAAAERHALLSQFVQTLGSVQKISRGPKPVRVLRELGFNAEFLGDEPTTPGIIAALERMELSGMRLAVQLYGDDPNKQLIDYLYSRDVREIIPVSPYRYAPQSESKKVLELIEKLHSSEVDYMTFTSKPQIHRLFNVAKKAELNAKLLDGLKKVEIAAVGPVVRELLESYGCKVSIMPPSTYFMKPLVRAMEDHAAGK